MVTALNINIGLVTPIWQDHDNVLFAKFWKYERLEVSHNRAYLNLLFKKLQLEANGLVVTLEHVDIEAGFGCWVEPQTFWAAHTLAFQCDGVTIEVAATVAFVRGPR